MNTNGIGVGVEAGTKSNYQETTLKDIVAENFKAANVFEKYGLDFCCKGNRPLKEACEDKTVNVETVVAELEALGSTAGTDNNRYELWELDYLIQYIINNHHKYITASTPVISAHLQKIASVHGKRHPYLQEVSRIFEAASNELLSHMFKEENILFPAIVNMLELKRANKDLKNVAFSVSMPIAVMEREHSSAGEAFDRIREITDNLQLPEDACNTFALTYNELDEFEKDLHRHVFLENNILFPKAIEMEKSLK